MSDFATAQCGATEALLEGSDGLRGIIESGRDAIIAVDEQQRILLFNAAAAKMFRCPPAEALGQTIDRFIPERFQVAHRAHIINFGETGGSNRNMKPRGPLSALRADGQEFRVEASVSHSVARGRKLFTVILRDITDRLRTEEALRTNEELLRLLLDGIKDYAVYMVDPEGRVASWNAGAARIKGYSREEILGQPISIFYPPHQQKNGIPALALQEAIAKGRFEGQGTRIRKDGSTFLARVVIVPMYEETGKLRGFAKVLHDITEGVRAEEKLGAQAQELSRQSEELKQSQQALEAQRRMLQSVLDSMAEGLVAADEQGKFIIWNPAAERILGRGATNLSSQQWSEHYGLFLADMVTPFPSDQLPLVRAIRGEASTAQMFVRNPELSEGVWIEASAGPLKDSHGMVRGGVVAFRDITQKRTSEHQIQKLNHGLERRVAERTAQLDEANKDLESFTYSVAHDLRAPLRHIAGFSGILVEDFGSALAPEAARYLQRIQDGTHKMGQLVDELLSLARVGRQALNLQPTGLSSMVEEVIGILQPEIAGRQLEWRIGDLPWVECDPTLTKQVFQNLISNALKYSRRSSPAVIEIGQMDVDGDSVIFVRDNGVGFSMKYADKLFGVFQRLHREEDFEGTGVGLATVQRIIKKHQGRVWAESELDRGATFYFTLGGMQTPRQNKKVWPRERDCELR
jgi:PAS domain S-box-containing protein